MEKLRKEEKRKRGYKRRKEEKLIKKGRETK